MNSKPISSQLTPYQTAMLTHMGIVSWKSRDTASAPEAPESTSQSAPTVDQKQAGLAKLKQQLTIDKAEDVKQNVLLAMQVNESCNQLLQDVLIALGLDEKPQVLADKSIAQYCNYSFAWYISDDFELNGKVLSTPPLNELTSMQAKRRLWTLLQQVSFN